MKKFICTVDGYRRPSRQRNTQGRYIVTARSEKEAEKKLQAAIKFGSIEILYEVTPEYGFKEEIEFSGNMAKCKYDRETKTWSFDPNIRSAISPIEGYVV